MDLFGIGSAMKSMTRMYIQSARATGRTTAMVESLKDGDRVCFTDSREAEHVHRICLDRKLKITCIVVPVANPGKIFEYPPSEGRTVFDHRWVENYYERAIQRCEKDIDMFERQSSGYGEAHRETKRQAYECKKWTCDDS